MGGSLSYGAVEKHSYYSLKQKHSVKHEMSTKYEPHFGPLTLFQSKRERLEAYSKIEHFYALDPLTFRSVEAAAAGAITVVVPVEGVGKEEWLVSAGDDFQYGIAYGEADKPHAVKTQHCVLPYLMRESMKQKKTVIHFIKEVIKFHKIPVDK